MADLAAHLVDDVFGGLPVRQWVLTLPHRLRYALAWDAAPRLLAVWPPAPGPGSRSCGSVEPRTPR